MKSQPPGWSSFEPPENLLSLPFGPSPMAVTTDAIECQSTRSPGVSSWSPSPAAKQLPPRLFGGPQFVPASALPAPISIATAVAQHASIVDRLPLPVRLRALMAPPFRCYGLEGSFFGLGSWGTSGEARLVLLVTPAALPHLLALCALRGRRRLAVRPRAGGARVARSAFGWELRV